MTRILLLRHGQTEWNAVRRLQGSTDIPMNDMGRAQAHAVAQVLAPQLSPGVRIVASPLSRARDTADILAAATGATVTDDARVTERSFGVWEGTTVEEREAADPEEVARWHSGREPRIGGYETHAVLAARVTAAVTEHAQASQEDLVIVSHGSALRMALTTLLDLDRADSPRRHSIEALGNACWSELEYSPPATWTLVAHNVGVGDSAAVKA